jgi:type I restriction enzyme S subunit
MPPAITAKKKTLKSASFNAGDSAFSLLDHRAWQKVRVGDALELINGRAFKPTEWSTSGLPIVRIQNLNNADAPFNYYQGDLPEKFLLDDSDLLFAWSGTPGTSFGAHIWRGGKAWLNQHIFKVKFDEAQFDKRFLQLAINQNLAEYIRAAHGGAGLAHITKGRFEESELPQPSLAEQRGIVEEIDKQFTRLDAGVKALRRVQANLKRYRAAVLKAACEGRLVPTEAELARQSGHPYEPASQLLARILTERRKNWKGRGKYKEPTGPDTADLPPLPEGWAWASSEQISSSDAYSLSIGPFGSNLKVSDYTDSGVPLIFVRNIRSVRFSGESTVFVSHEKANELKAHQASGGDILVTKMGAPPGDACLYPETAPDAVITADCIKLRPSHLLPERLFFVHAINSEIVKPQILGITKGVAQMKVSLDRFSRIGIPLPPVAEQTRIVAEVERRLSVIAEVESVVTANLQRANRLRQSILQQAFAKQSFPGTPGSTAKKEQDVTKRGLRRLT